MAEYMGGIWRIFPRKWARAPSSSSRVTDTGRFSRISPVVSWVLVTTPSFISARYSFSDSLANSTARVARPMNTGSTPVAMGSRVPAWPTRFSWKIPRSLAHTSMEVQSRGLSMMMIPFGIRRSLPVRQASALLRRPSVFAPAKTSPQAEFISAEDVIIIGFPQTRASVGCTRPWKSSPGACR